MPFFNNKSFDITAVCVTSFWVINFLKPILILWSILHGRLNTISFNCIFAFLASSLNRAHSTMTQRSPLMFTQHVLSGFTKVNSHGGRKLKGEKLSRNPKFMETLTIFRFLTNVGGGNPFATLPLPPWYPCMYRNMLETMSNLKSFNKLKEFCNLGRF